MGPTPKDSRGKAAATTAAATGSEQSTATSPRPWEDSALEPKARLEAYEQFVKGKIAEILESYDRAQGDLALQRQIAQAPETQRWAAEGKSLEGCTPEQFVERYDLSTILGPNLLGAKAWKANGIDVGQEPPIPAAITKALLESGCPLHPGEKIKDTHLLVLVPKTVNGKPYTALELDALCATRKGSGDKLIYGGFKSWKTQGWASTPQAQSEWVLIPKSDPDPKKVPKDKHFRSKNIAAGQQVHDIHYEEYREVKTLELMTAMLLNDLVNGEPRMLDGENYLRCVEASTSGGRVCVGYFAADGLGVNVDAFGGAGRVDGRIGRALARKLPSQP